MPTTIEQITNDALALAKSQRAQLAEALLHSLDLHPLESGVQKLEAAVAGLSEEQLGAFREWFEEFAADAWDRQIEEDVQAGRLDHLIAEADREFEAGRCTPI